MDSTTMHQPEKNDVHVKHAFYQWHIRIGLMILILLMLWALGGLMGLLINYESGSVGTYYKNAILLSEELPDLSLQEVMIQNELRSLRNFHLVEINGKRYYQLRDSYNRLQYFEANTGEPLPNGDQVYAEHLARYFAQEQGSSVDIHIQKVFSQQYPESNRLLPVYRVSFDRLDAMNVYVETEQSRLSAFRNLADKIFFWSFFEDISSPSLRLTFQILLFGILVIFALSGWWIYGLKWQHYKIIQVTDSNPLFYKYQRYVGLTISLLVFAFACHGAFYTLRKSDADNTLRFVKNAIFSLEDLSFDIRKLPWTSTQSHSASVINMPQGNFYQLFGKDAEGKEHTYYFDTETGEELKEGDWIYARYLANKFKAHKANIDAGVSFSCCLPPDTIPDGTQTIEAGIKATTSVTHFDEEYGFSYKRLPVVRVSYISPPTNYFIETASSRLAGIVDKSNRREAHLLGVLHDFHFLDKLANIRNSKALFLIFIVSILFVTSLGFISYLIWEYNLWKV